MMTRPRQCSCFAAAGVDLGSLDVDLLASTASPKLRQLFARGVLDLRKDYKSTRMWTLVQLVETCIREDSRSLGEVILHAAS